jgi:hypothetical protein
MVFSNVTIVSPLIYNYKERHCYGSVESTSAILNGRGSRAVLKAPDVY